MTDEQFQELMDLLRERLPKQAGDSSTHITIQALDSTEAYRKLQQVEERRGFHA